MVSHLRPALLLSHPCAIEALPPLPTTFASARLAAPLAASVPGFGWLRISVSACQTSIGVASFRQACDGVYEVYTSEFQQAGHADLLQFITRAFLTEH